MSTTLVTIALVMAFSVLLTNPPMRPWTRVLWFLTAATFFVVGVILALREPLP